MLGSDEAVSGSALPLSLARQQLQIGTHRVVLRGRVCWPTSGSSLLTELLCFKI